MFFRFLLILLISINLANAKTIDLSKSFNIEKNLKGKALKEFFSNHTFTISRDNKTLQYKFKNKIYEVTENGKIIETGGWKMNAFTKKHIKLKPAKGSKSYFFKKLKDKPIIYRFNGLPGKEGVTKETYKIVESSSPLAQKQIASFKGSAEDFDEDVKKEKNKLNKAVGSIVSNTLGVSKDISKSFGEFGASSEVSYYFFQASGNYLKALEFLHRAYDNNVEADKIFASLEYMKNSKIDENERLSSTKMLIDSSSKSIKANVQNSSVALSEIGRTYYEKALPFAFAAAESTINLYGATSRTIQNITNNSGGSNLNSLLSNFAEVGAIASVLPELPAFVKNMNTTIKFVFSGAKEKKIRDNGNLSKALDELELPDIE